LSRLNRTSATTVSPRRRNPSKALMNGISGAARSPRRILTIHSVETPWAVEARRPGYAEGMCDLGHAHDSQPHAHQPYGFLVDTPQIRALIEETRRVTAAIPDVAARVEALRPAYAALLAADGWLPDSCAVPDETSKMGGGIGQYALYRAEDKSLCLFSLVVPAGAATPVHDHLAWGLVGVYRGNQDEEFYRPQAGRLELVRRRPLDPGDFYALLPPRDDVHRVRTTSAQTSVSIHLLANDTGCVWRHTYDEQTGEPRPFRSGYVNAECVSES
jgi:predicted metal-dependent enzyme (double-stranded beta helix superfamily)